ncbi:MAG TPA: hypothetical protein VGG56_09690 [Terracidiphilus sp.]
MPTEDHTNLELESSQPVNVSLIGRGIGARTEGVNFADFEPKKELEEALPAEPNGNEEITFNHPDSKNAARRRRF